MRFVLVHSPLVGPTSWRLVAFVLRQSGHDVVVPDLRDAAMTGEAEAIVRCVCAAIDSRPSIVVGHSGAGFFLPLIAAAPTAVVERIVFVDSGIPPPEGAATPSANFLDELRALAVRGVLPRWSTWWGEDAMALLVPDAERRSEIVSEMPEIPLDLYERVVTFPPAWRDSPTSFLLLSEGYRHDAERALSLGRPVVERLGRHFDIANDPMRIAEDLDALAR